MSEVNMDARWYPAARNPALCGSFLTECLLPESGELVQRRIEYRDGEWDCGDLSVLKWLQDRPAPIDDEIDEMLALVDPDVWKNALEVVAPQQLRAAAHGEDPVAQEFAVASALGAREIEASTVRVDVVRVFRVAADATVLTSGRILAVSENFAAQNVGGDVVVHENARLSHVVSPGDEVTVRYENGNGHVFSGVVDHLRVVIHAPGLDDDVRMAMSVAVRARLQAMPNLLKDEISIVHAATAEAKRTLSQRGADIPDVLLVTTHDEVMRDAKSSALARQGKHLLNLARRLEAENTAAARPGMTA